MNWLEPHQPIPELFPRESLEDTKNGKIHVARKTEYSGCLDRSFSVFDIRSRVFDIMDNTEGLTK